MAPRWLQPQEEATGPEAVGRWFRLVVGAALGPLVVSYPVLLVGPLFTGPSAIPGPLVRTAFAAALTWGNLLAPALHAVGLGSVAVILTFAQWAVIGVLVFFIGRRLRAGLALLMSVALIAFVGFGLFRALALMGIQFAFDGP